MEQAGGEPRQGQALAWTSDEQAPADWTSMQATASESHGSPSHCGQASPDQGKAGSQIHWPQEGGTQPKTDADALPESPACRCGCGGNVIPPQGPYEPAALGLQTWAPGSHRPAPRLHPSGSVSLDSLSPFKPCSRDPQAVACGHQTLISQGAALSDSGQSVLPVTGSSKHLLDTALGAFSGHVARSARLAGGRRSGGGGREAQGSVWPASCPCEMRGLHHGRT